MNTRIARHPVLGECLYADNGVAEVGIPQEYGLRIGRFALCSGPNVFYEQPADADYLTTPEGWRVRGGHRLWLAPESERCYYPDNDPVEWRVEGNHILGVQREDPRLGVRKHMILTFGEGARIEVLHRVENTRNEALRCALWGISSMAPGGVQRLRLPLRSGGYNPLHHLSLWDYTSLGDPRAEYALDGIILRHRPLEERYKIGVGHPLGAVEYENDGGTFALEYPVNPELEYPDGGVSYETFMCRHMVEMETLSPLKIIPPGGSMEHRETWTLR